MKTIWKYAYSVGDRIITAVPKGAVLLSIQMQNGFICFWYELDPDQTAEVQRDFRIVGTGMPTPEPRQEYVYHGTFQDGPFVWHAYEKAHDGQKPR